MYKNITNFIRLFLYDVLFSSAHKIKTNKKPLKCIMLILNNIYTKFTINIRN